jgi:hypothetical protein
MSFIHRGSDPKLRWMRRHRGALRIPAPMGLLFPARRQRQRRACMEAGNPPRATARGRSSSPSSAGGAGAEGLELVRRPRPGPFDRSWACQLRHDRGGRRAWAPSPPSRTAKGRRRPTVRQDRPGAGVTAASASAAPDHAPFSQGITAATLGRTAPSRPHQTGDTIYRINPDRAEAAAGFPGYGWADR